MRGAPGWRSAVALGELRGLSVSAGSCSGWGGAHYLTFDGTPYSFRNNCTHVVMREIRPRHGNLSVLLDKGDCGAPARCAPALSVHYKSMEIVLTTTTTAEATAREEGLVRAEPEVRAPPAVSSQRGLGVRGPRGAPELTGPLASPGPV